MKTLAEVMAEINDRPKGYYTYLLYYPDGTAFYVGMGLIRTDGKGQRIMCHEREARRGVQSLKTEVIKTIWAEGGIVRYEVDGYFDTSAAAKDRERSLIASIGRADLNKGPLTNLTAGANGPWDIVLSPEVRARIVAACRTPEYRARASERHEDPLYSKYHAEATRAGMKRPEIKARMIEAKLGTKFDPVRVERHRAAYQTEAVAEHMSAASYQRWSDPDYRKRRGEQQRAFNERRRYLVEVCHQIIAASGVSYSLPSGRDNLATWERAFAELSAHFQTEK
jgi:hypothetical protein